MMDSCFVPLWATAILVVGLFHSISVRAEMPSIVIPEESPTIVTNEGRIKSKSIATSALAFVKECRNAGFDPMQLACTTCAILPEKHQTKCGECCQSYKTLEKRSKRYEMAYLLNTGYPESVQEFVREDKDQVLDQKGDSRFHVQDYTVDRNMMGMMGMFQQEPSAIFWFDQKVDINGDLQEIVQSADEITVLTGRGLGRDDMRDMLLTLLPDKN